MEPRLSELPTVPATIIMEGLPINALYGWKTNGFFQNYDEIQNAALPTGIDRSQLRPGDVRYVDLNSDGKIDENDRTYLGYAFPRYTYGFTYNVKVERHRLQHHAPGRAEA